MSYQRQFETGADSFATNDESNGYRYAITLPKLSDTGYWRIDRFYAMASTDYDAANTNYETFSLYDSDGNAIASIANGPATGGIDIGPKSSGVDTTMTDAYRYISCMGDDSEIYVKPASTGAGRSMVGVRFVVIATPIRG